jgi:hypothetical protein
MHDSDNNVSLFIYVLFAFFLSLASLQVFEFEVYRAYMISSILSAQNGKQIFSY